MYNRKHVFSLDACSICGFDARHPLPASPCRSNTATSSMNVCCLCVCVCVCGACRNEYYTLFNFHCSVFNVHCCQIHSFERHSYWHRILHYCIAPHAYVFCNNFECIQSKRTSHMIVFQSTPTPCGCLSDFISD